MKELSSGISKSVKLSVAAVLLLITGIICAITFHHTVPVGEEAAVSAWGEVVPGVIKKGSGFKWPSETYDSYNLQTRTWAHRQEGIASQDNFKTKMDIIYTGNFLAGHAARIRNEVGTSDVFLNTHLHNTVLSCVSKAGVRVAESKDFFLETNQLDMAQYAMDCTNDYLNEEDVGGGFKLTKVQFVKINVDPRVDAFMVKTKGRIAAEDQQKSDARIAESKEMEKVTAAKANADAARYEKASREALADAQFYEDTKKAEGNKLLNSSITPSLVKYIEANRWNGSKATTVLSSDSKIEYQLGN